MSRLDPTTCDHCGLVGDDRASVSDEDREWGFCSRVCMVLFVSERYIEENAVLSITRAAAAPAPEVVGPPSMASGAGAGSAREPVGSGKSPVAPGRIHLEGGRP